MEIFHRCLFLMPGERFTTSLKIEMKNTKGVYKIKVKT